MICSCVVSQLMVKGGGGLEYLKDQIIFSFHCVVPISLLELMITAHTLRVISLIFYLYHLCCVAQHFLPT